MNHPPPTRGVEGPQPPSSDASWPRRCGPLLAFLSTPRTWDELDGWASERGMSGCRLRNMLAWLEDTGKAAVFPDRGEPTLGSRHGPTWRRCAAPPG